MTCSHIRAPETSTNYYAGLTTWQDIKPTSKTSKHAHEAIEKNLK